MVRQDVLVPRVWSSVDEAVHQVGQGAPTAAGAGPAQLVVEWTCKQHSSCRGVLCRDWGKRQVTLGSNNIQGGCCSLCEQPV